MSMATGLYARLVAQATSAEKVYPLRLPEDPSLPALTYQQIAGPREYTHDGEAGPHRLRWQITAWGETYEAAKELAEEVVLALSAWEDTSGVHVERCVAFIANEIDLFDEDAELFYVPIDAVILVEVER